MWQLLQLQAAVPKQALAAEDEVVSQHDLDAIVAQVHDSYLWRRGGEEEGRRRNTALVLTLLETSTPLSLTCTTTLEAVAALVAAVAGRWEWGVGAKVLGANTTQGLDTICRSGTNHYL